MRIKLTLSPDGIKRAQEEVLAYKSLLDERLEEFVRRLADIGVDVASAKFSTAQYDGDNDVTVHMEQNGKVARVVAEGKAVAFIEFGTGIAYPEHPSGSYKHGTYGRGQGANPNGWVYNGSPGSRGQPVIGRDGLERPGVYRSRGNPPAEAMWSAATEMAAQITQIWREVMRK